MSSIRTIARILGGAAFPLALALVAIAPTESTPALADAPSTITGSVSATPARYLGETVVYLKNAPAGHTPVTVSIDQRSMQFIPHVSAITVGDTISFGNHDTVAHNVFSPDNEGFNLGTFPPNQTRTYTFRRNAGYSLLCSVHPEMLGYVFVSPTPYHAVVDASGHFTIANVPPGTYTVGVWNPKLHGGDQSATVASGGSASVSFSIRR